MIRDLLNPSSGFLDLREDSKGEIQVAGITEVSTVNAREVSYTLHHHAEKIILTLFIVFLKLSELARSNICPKDMSIFTWEKLSLSRTVICSCLIDYSDNQVNLQTYL